MENIPFLTHNQIKKTHSSIFYLYLESFDHNELEKFRILSQIRFNLLYMNWFISPFSSKTAVEIQQKQIK